MPAASTCFLRHWMCSSSPRADQGALRGSCVASGTLRSQSDIRGLVTMKDKVVLVTGGGGKGCGRAIASRFASLGAAVVICDINEDGGRDAVRQIESSGGRAAFFAADVAEEGEVKALVDFTRRTFGKLSVLVNNASAPHGDDRIESWTKTLNIDLLGAMHATRWAIEAMRASGGGAIVNVASISALWHGRTTPGGLAGYDVAKMGMIRMTTRLAPLADTDS